MKTTKLSTYFLPVLCILILGVTSFAQSTGLAPEGAQSTGFTYQGSLNNSNLPATGNYDFEFKLFTTVTGGSQQGTTQQLLNVVVSNGTFTVPIDFGASGFPGEDRYLEISLRPAGGAGFTTLTPRQQVTRTPYSISSLSAVTASFATNAATATTATTANNALQLGGVAANNFVQTNDARLSDARNPLPGNANYIQNTTTPQTLSNFNITGNGTAGGTLTGGIVNAATELRVANIRILKPGFFSLFAGYNAGINNTGAGNSFFGINAGEANTAGFANSFFGSEAGKANIDGDFNSFYGVDTGKLNTGGNNNSYFGYLAGNENLTGNSNSFFGYRAGAENKADNNSFFGTNAGLRNSTGLNNSFFGFEAGRNNTVGDRNSFFGFNAGSANLNSNANSFFGYNAGSSNTGLSNSFFGSQTGESNTGGQDNAFYGTMAGQNNLDGDSNSFFGRSSGRDVTSGNSNSFFGRDAGLNTTSGDSNVFIGNSAGTGNTTGNANTVIGAGANVSAFNSFATVIGAGATAFGSNSVTLGRPTDTVYVLGQVIIGDPCCTFDNIKFEVRGESFFNKKAIFIDLVEFRTLGAAGSTTLCINNSNRLANCSSSLRYKTDIAPFSSGLNLVNRLRPITFSWKEGGMHDLGLGAEDVAAVEPLLATYNERGEVEGVKYDRVAVVLLNAVKEQQEMIQKQQAQIEELKRILSSIQQNKTVSKTIRRAKR